MIANRFGFIVASVVMVLGTMGKAEPGEQDRNSLKVKAGDLRLVIGERATLPEQRAAELFAREVRSRTGLELTIAKGENGIPAKYNLHLATKTALPQLEVDEVRDDAMAGLGADGFYLCGVPDKAGRLLVIGANPGNVIAGVGKLLRGCRFDEGSLTLPRMTLKDIPGMPVRGIYFASHFFNFYHVAPLEEVERIIEECALWGLNSLVVWFDMHHFTGIDAPDAQKHIERLRHFQKTAHEVGMEVGLVFLANEGYESTPKTLLAQWLPHWSHYHVEVCPGTAEGLALIAKNQSDVLDAFKPVDFVWSWPYDQGGCNCEKCRPWGGNGFIKASEQLARLFHERQPKGKVWLSTWLLDSMSANGQIQANLVTGIEYPGLFKYLRGTQPAWMAGIVMGAQGDGVPAPLLERPFPDRYPLTCFPEISMHMMNPWGSCGANPLPGVCGRLAGKLRKNVVGGWPYSEGIYEDLNKFFWAGFYWAPDRPADEILAEYASYYLAPGVAGDAVKMFHLMEKTLPRNELSISNLGEADEVWRLAVGIDASIPAVNRKSWRWRVLHIRAQVDHILKNQGSKSAESHAALRPLFDELVQIYHSENCLYIRPPKLGEPAGSK